MKYPRSFELTLYQAYTFSFNYERGFNSLDASLPHLAVVLGIILGSIYISHYSLNTFASKLKLEGTLQPEDRLPPMIVGAAVLPIGLFWFSWTSSPLIPPWPQIIAGVPIGAGIQIITLQSLSYLIDIYATNSASAISGVMIARSLIGGLLPMVAIPLYQNFGVSSSTCIVCFYITVTNSFFQGPMGYNNCRLHGTPSVLRSCYPILLWGQDSVWW